MKKHFLWFFLCAAVAVQGQSIGSGKSISRSSRGSGFYASLPPGPPPGQAFSDDFNRASSASLGANWTEADGTWSIINNADLEANEGGFNFHAAIYSGLACDSINQYMRIDYEANYSGSSIPGAIFRYTNASTEFYRVDLDDNANTFNAYHGSAIGGTYTLIGSVAFTIAPANTYGITITGTGDDVVWRVWANPSGTPTAADNWGGAAGASITANPGANNVDAGNYTGLCDVHNNGTQLDNYFGGDIP